MQFFSRKKESKNWANLNVRVAFFYVVHCISKYFSRQHVRACWVMKLKTKVRSKWRVKKLFNIYTQNRIGDGKIARKAISQSAWSDQWNDFLLLTSFQCLREREGSFMTFSHWWHRHKLSGNRINSEPREKLKIF